MTENIPLNPFLRIASKHRSILGIIFKEGKTGIKERNGSSEFKTVPRHSLVVATVSETIAEMFELDSETKEKLVVAALLHDADKKLELKPDEFSEAEKIALKKNIELFNPDLNIISATKEGFVDKYEDDVNQISLPQMIMYYSDMIVEWDQIVRFRERMESLKKKEKGNT